MSIMKSGGKFNVKKVAVGLFIFLTMMFGFLYLLGAGLFSIDFSLGWVP